MVSERGVRFSHTGIFVLIFLASVVATAISGTLVAHYNSEGYPPVNTGAYRDRIRICLVGAVWSAAISRELRLIWGGRVGGKSAHTTGQGTRVHGGVVEVGAKGRVETEAWKGEHRMVRQLGSAPRASLLEQFFGTMCDAYCAPTTLLGIHIANI